MIRTRSSAVKSFFARMWHEQDGVLSFEWTLLTSLLTVGVVSGIASVRDAVTDEMGDLSQAMVNLDQSYVIEPPLGVQVHTTYGGGWGFGGGWGWGWGGSSAAGSQFIDAASYRDCYRTGHMRVQEFPGAARPDGQNPPAPMTPAAPEPSL
jgi:Flp pilus assembly pilin Flp